MKFSVFTKILLLLLAIFMGLAYYAYGVFQKEKEAIENKKIIVKVNKPMPHPPLSDKENNINSSTTALIINENNSSENNESNKTLTHLQGAEYISPEELERRALEENLSEETFYEEGEIIPEDEINNYPISQTIPLAKEVEVITPQPQEAIPIPQPRIESIPVHAPTPSSNPLLGERIDRPTQRPKSNAYPSLGTPIGNGGSNPF